MSEKTLPEWPERDPEQRGKSFRQQITEWNEVTGAMNDYYANECCYFPDDADRMIAALSARLRLAVEALQAVEDESRLADEDNECADETHQLALDALSAIGPLPPGEGE